MIHKLLEQFQVLGLPENGGEYAELKNVLRESGLLIDEFDNAFCACVSESA